MEQITPEQNAGDASHEQKVSVSGKISLENSPFSDTNKAISDIATAINDETNRKNQEASTKDIIPDRQATAQERANSIAIFAIIVAAFAFGATLAVFFQNKKAVEAATSSAIAANNTVEIYRDMLAESRRYDTTSLNKQESFFKENYKLQKGSSESTDKNNREILDFYNKTFTATQKYNDSSIEISKQYAEAAKISSIIAQNSLEEAKKSAEENRIILEDENRAFITIDSIKIDTSEGLLVVWGGIKNVGKTSAYNVRGMARCFVSENENFLDTSFIKDFELRAFNSPNQTVEAGKPAFVQWPDNKEMMNDEFMKLGKNRNKKIYIIAAYRYEDIFKRTHFVHAFGEYRFEIGSFYIGYKYNDSN